VSPHPVPPWLRALPDLERCILCRRRRVHALAMFIPREPWLYCPAPPTPGKGRVLFYALCRRCFRRPDRAAEAVEAECLRRMRRPPP